VSHHVSAGNWTWVLWKSNKCSYPLSRLSSLKQCVLKWLNVLHVSRDVQDSEVNLDGSFFSFAVLGKSNMGDSPKKAVTRIRELLSIEQNRDDYLGEALPYPSPISRG
jgi:hypothetical protein